MPAEKLEEFFQSFKEVCNNYTISLQDFEAIFSSDETAYKIWKSNEADFVDSFEVFSGLIIFSSLSFEEKLDS